MRAQLTFPFRVLISAPEDKQRRQKVIYPCFSYPSYRTYYQKSSALALKTSYSLNSETPANIT
jgi:hypothetical protein